MTQADVIRLLRTACRKAGSQSAFAESADLSPAYVSDVLAGRREPGDGILTALGLVKVVSYQRQPRSPTVQ